MNKRTSNRKQKGVSLVEFAAALVLGLPLVMSILYATLEASYLFTIRSNLELAGRKAARTLAIEYGKDATVKDNSGKEATVFNQCLIPGFTASAAQFDAIWDTATTPATVTVVVNYPTANTNTTLPTFPNPDPFHLGGNFEIKSAATFSLE